MRVGQRLGQEDSGVGSHGETVSRLLSGSSTIFLFADDSACYSRPERMMDISSHRPKTSAIT